MRSQVSHQGIATLGSTSAQIEARANSANQGAVAGTSKFYEREESTTHRAYNACAQKHALNELSSRAEHAPLDTPGSTGARIARDIQLSARLPRASREAFAPSRLTSEGRAKRSLILGNVCADNW